MSFNAEMKNCKFMPLTDLLSFIVDNRGKTVPTAEVGIPLIATNCIKNDELYPVFERVRYITNETYDSWFRSHPKPGDIIFVNKGTPGRVCLVPNIVNFCIAQDMMAFRVNEEKIYNRYLFAVLRSSQFQTQISNYHVGTMIPHFKKGDLDKLLIPVPSYAVQKYIGDFYFNYCEKIETNKKINSKLLEIAREIYNYNFINCNQYINDEYENSEIGIIPLNWEMGTLADLVEIKYGKDHKKLEDGNIPVYGSGGVMRYVNEKIYDGESVLIPRKGSLNNVMYVNEPFWSVDTMFYTIMKEKNIAKYIYFFMESKDLLAMNSGSAVPSMTTQILNNMLIKVPPSNVLESFNKAIEPIFAKIKSNKEENKVLSNIRDTLLPRLMNGEIELTNLNLEA
ncbi:hypothetical protein GND98_017365 [Clostridium butyricum]|uniref:Type I restriction modification DNA specificity domain-containing protein n=1 Tax=Clostridium butyricum TaxID=1492 RepID=A0A6L9ESL1_CLOBU|nr:hypothetical protein [Clostridium butyricum]